MVNAYAIIYKKLTAQLFKGMTKVLHAERIDDVWANKERPKTKITLIFSQN
jgi:hypothetical protein